MKWFPKQTGYRVFVSIFLLQGVVVLLTGLVLSYIEHHNVLGGFLIAVGIVSFLAAGWASRTACATEALEPYLQWRKK